MNILGELLGSTGGGIVGQLSRQFGLGETDTRRAMAGLIPTLSRAMKNNAGSSDGLGGLLSALGRGEHARYVDDPSVLASDESRLDGNKILGHLLGDKSASREAASRAASETGIDAGILKKMLPLVATVLMGTVGKGALARGLQQADPAAQSGGIASMLDLDGDGSVADDLLNLARKFF